MDCNQFGEEKRRGAGEEERSIMTSARKLKFHTSKLTLIKHKNILWFSWQQSVSDPTAQAMHML